MLELLDRLNRISVLTDRVLMQPLDLARLALLAAVATTRGLKVERMYLKKNVKKTVLLGNETWFDEDTVDLTRNHFFTNLSNVCDIGYKPQKQCFT